MPRPKMFVETTTRRAKLHKRDEVFTYLRSEGLVKQLTFIVIPTPSRSPVQRTDQRWRGGTARAGPAAFDSRPPGPASPPASTTAMSAPAQKPRSRPGGTMDRSTGYSLPQPLMASVTSRSIRHVHASASPATDVEEHPIPLLRR